MWNAARRFERAAERAAAERARKAVLHAIGYEPTPAPAGIVEQLLHDSFFGIVPFFILIAKACFLTFALLMFSVGTYVALWSLVMKGQEVNHRPLFFDYSLGTPVGIVDLRSEKTWTYSPSCAENATHSKSPILDPGSKYFFEVSLTLPESNINKQVGVFMVKVDLKSNDGLLMATSKQHSMLPYESDMVSLFRRTMLILPLSSRIIPETRTINLLCFDNYLDPHGKISMSLVEVSLGLISNPSIFPQKLQQVQVESAELRYGREMSAIQMLVRNWWWSCAFLGTLIIFIAYTFIALRILKHKARRKRQVTQPYADLFDSIDGSVQFSASHPASCDRWTGLDIEILEDDGDTSGPWVPISPTRESANQTEELESENVVSDNDSCSHGENAQYMSFEGNDANLSQAHPQGLAGNEGIESIPDRTKRSNHQIEKGNNTREKEEKILADMVMKGQSKRDLFRGGECSAIRQQS